MRLLVVVLALALIFHKASRQGSNRKHDPSYEVSPLRGSSKGGTRSSAEVDLGQLLPLPSFLP